MNRKLILYKYKEFGLEATVQYILEKYDLKQIEEEFFEIEGDLDTRKKNKDTITYFSIIKKVYNNRYGDFLTEENKEKLAEEIRNLYDNEFELENAIKECSQDYLKWYQSSNLSKFTLPDYDMANKKFFLKNLLLNKNMTINVGNKTSRFYLKDFGSSSFESSIDLSFLLTNDYLSSSVLVEYLKERGEHLEPKDIMMIIKSNKADSLVLNLIIEKCFDEELVYKRVSPISSKLWGSNNSDGIPNVGILENILFKDKIEFEIFSKILRKIKKCHLYYKVLSSIYKIDDLFIKFVKSGEIPKEEIINLIIDYGFILSDYCFENLEFDEVDLCNIVRFSHVNCNRLRHFVNNNNADENVYNSAIIKALASNPSFPFKNLINIIQEKDNSYNNCLCDTIKEKCSISGEYNRGLHPFLLSFCVAGILDSDVRSKCCNMKFVQEIDFDGLSNYFYDNDITFITDLFNNDGSIRSDICTNIKKFLGEDLFNLFESFCIKLRELFDVERYELDCYSGFKYDSDADKFMVLCSLIMNNIPKDDKLDNFIEKSLESWYKLLNSSEIFNKKFNPVVAKKCKVIKY